MARRNERGVLPFTARANNAIRPACRRPATSREREGPVILSEAKDPYTANCRNTASRFPTTLVTRSADTVNAETGTHARSGKLETQSPAPTEPPRPTLRITASPRCLHAQPPARRPLRAPHLPLSPGTRHARARDDCARHRGERRDLQF